MSRGLGLSYTMQSVVFLPLGAPQMQKDLYVIRCTDLNENSVVL